MIMWLFQYDFYITGAINLKSCPPFFCEYFWHYVVPSVTFDLRNGFSFLVDIKKIGYLLDKIKYLWMKMIVLGIIFVPMDIKVSLYCTVQTLSFQSHKCMSL